MTANAPENARSDTDPMRIAAELRWKAPRRAWGEIAKEMHVDPKTIYRWRQSERWEIVFREAGQEYVETLAPAAVTALVRSWDDGHATGAIEVLRSYGFLRNERLDVDITDKSRDLDQQIEALIEKLVTPTAG